MQINFAHVRVPSVSGADINYVLFESRSATGTFGDNAALLAQLTMRARASGLRVDQSALVFVEAEQIRFQGTKPLVDHLSRTGVPGWTHSFDT